MVNSASNIAKGILLRGSQEEDNDLSNLKLQKLLYYVQGFCLALHGKPCFRDPITAWQHGPVVVSVYDEYKSFGRDPIPTPLGFDYTSIDEETRDLLEEVFETYGQFSAWRLREMTHEETPWKSTEINEQISLELMEEFFKTRLRDG